MTVNLVMTVNYLMASSESITSWLLVMTVNYLMALVMRVNYLMDSSDDGQLPHGF